MNNATITTPKTRRRCSLAVLAAAAALLGPVSFCEASFLDIGQNRDNLSLDMDEVLLNFGRARQIQKEEDESRRLEIKHSQVFTMQGGTTLSIAFKNQDEKDRRNDHDDEDHNHSAQVEEFVARQNILPERTVPPAVAETVPPSVEEQPVVVVTVETPAPSSQETNVADVVTVETPAPSSQETNATDVVTVETPAPSSQETNATDNTPDPQIVNETPSPTSTPGVGTMSPTVPDRPATPPVFGSQEQTTEDPPAEEESKPEVNSGQNQNGFFVVDEESEEEIIEEVIDPSPAEFISDDEMLDVATTDAQPAQDSGPRGGPEDHSPGLNPTEISFMILMDEFRYAKGIDSISDIGIGTKFAFTGRIATKAEELGTASGSCTVTSDVNKELSYCDIYHRIETDNYGGFGSVMVAGTADEVGGRLLVTGTGGSLQNTHEGYAMMQFDPTGNPVLYMLLKLF